MTAYEQTQARLEAIESTAASISESRPDDLAITATRSFGLYSVDQITSGNVRRLKTALTPEQCLIYLEGLSTGFDIGLELSNL